MADKAMYLAEAVHRFEPVEAYDLGLEVGDIVEVLALDVAELGEGWNMGRLNGRTGFYPGAYTQRAQPPPAAEVAAALQQEGGRGHRVQRVHREQQPCEEADGLARGRGDCSVKERRDNGAGGGCPRQ